MLCESGVSGGMGCVSCVCVCECGVNVCMVCEGVG